MTMTTIKTHSATASTAKYVVRRFNKNLNARRILYIVLSRRIWKYLINISHSYLRIFTGFVLAAIIAGINAPIAAAPIANKIIESADGQST